MSKRQLLTSYAMIIAIITLAGWTAMVSFPLTGQAEVPKAVQEPDEPAGDVGFVVSLDPIRYPATAVEAGILGEVVVELTFNLDGVVTDSRVLSGPEELRQTALRSALREEYEVSSARTLQVVVPFVTGTPPPPNPDQAEVLRVASAVSQENLIEQAPPRYPQAAREERIQGLVRLETRIDPEGNVTEARVLEGDQLLAAAARVAVLQWKYKPTLLNGQPIGITTTVNVNFSLN
jgi:TonB family protein